MQTDTYTLAEETRVPRTFTNAGVGLIYLNLSHFTPYIYLIFIGALNDSKNFVFSELGQRATSVRSCYDIACSENAVEFLTELGCRLEFEYVAKGFVFRKGRMKITVSKIHKIAQGPPQPNGPPQEALEPMTASHLVELSVLAPSGSDVVADDMKNFAEQLKPLVQMDKIDPRRAMPV